MKILIFILLKLAEIAAIVFVPHYIGRLALIYIFSSFDAPPAWIVGIMTLLLAIAVLSGLWLLSIGVWLLIKANWQWAGRIIK